MVFNLANLADKAIRTPTVLYHGSAFKAEELKPGFQHTGKLVNWDSFESNAYLYASDSREAAELLGISSAWEKRYDLKSTHFNEQAKTIKLVFYKSKIPTIQELKGITTYLYVIKFTDDWKNNSNPYNKLDGEYKTKSTITAIEERELLDVPEVLKDFTITTTSEQ